MYRKKFNVFTRSFAKLFAVPDDLFASNAILCAPRATWNKIKKLFAYFPGSSNVQKSSTEGRSCDISPRISLLSERSFRYQRDFLEDGRTDANVSFGWIFQYHLEKFRKQNSLRFGIFRPTCLFSLETSFIRRLCIILK